MSRFFIDRPVFAWVIAIGLMLAGSLAIVNLPINQFPDVAPPAISVQVVYPGATAQTVRDTAVQVIEQQLNGLDGLRYISSDSNADGTATIIATFEQGTDPDIAQVQVQNKLQVATPMLPQEVQRQGLRVVKYKQNFMLVLALVSEDGRMSSGDLGDLVASTLQDPIARTPGVGDFQLLGSQYAMRIWLDPERLNGFQLAPQDVIGAIQAENVQVASGQVGGLPAHEGVQLSASVIGKVRMKTAEEFERILLKVNADGSQVRLRDVGDQPVGAAGGRGGPGRRRVRGVPARGAVRLHDDRAGARHAAAADAAGGRGDLQPHPRGARRAEAPLPLPLARPPGLRAGGADRPAAGAGRRPAGWPSRSTAAARRCAGPTCSSRRASPRRWTGPRRWPRSAPAGWTRARRRRPSARW